MRPGQRSKPRRPDSGGRSRRPGPRGFGPGPRCLRGGTSPSSPAPVPLASQSVPSGGLPFTGADIEQSVGHRRSCSWRAVVIVASVAAGADVLSVSGVAPGTTSGRPRAVGSARAHVGELDDVAGGVVHERSQDRRAEVDPRGSVHRGTTRRRLRSVSMVASNSLGGDVERVVGKAAAPVSASRRSR